MVKPEIETSSAGQKRLLLVDAYPLVRAGLKLAADSRPSLQICGEVAEHQEVIPQIRALAPDVVALGLSHQHSHWLELLKDIRVHFPTLLVLVIAPQDQFLYAQRAIQAGANGYLTLREPLKAFGQAVDCLLAGQIYVSKGITTQMADQMAGRRRPDQGLSVQDLTDRELEIFELTGHGLGMAQMASRLHLSKSTVETYRTRIKEKLHFSNNSQMLQAAIEWRVTGNLPAERVPAAKP